MATMDAPVGEERETPNLFDLGVDELCSLRPSEQIVRMHEKVVYGSLFVQRQHGLAVCAQRVHELLLDTEDEDPEDRPSLETVNRADDLLYKAYANMTEYFFPRGWVSPLPDGGIRIEWARKGRHVRLSLPNAAASPAYIYYEDDGVHFSTAPSPDVLADALVRLADA